MQLQRRLQQIVPNNIQILTIAEIAGRLSTLAHLVSLEKANPYKLRRTVGQAKQIGCFFEINSSPDRLDLSPENARVAAGVLIAISTDAHSVHEFGTVRPESNRTVRAGLERTSV